jgi:TRAP-type C4-dicarboxylate transport system permease large subunit
MAAKGVARAAVLSATITGTMSGVATGTPGAMTTITLQELLAPRSYSPTTASASTSTSISGEIKLLTCTMLVAGRIDPKNSPCARPTFSH